MAVLRTRASSSGRTDLRRSGSGLGAGCHLNRKIDELIAAAGFEIGELGTCYLPGPRLMTYTYQGFARPV
jgi:hypothetical protein